MKQNKIPRNEYIRKPVGKTNPYKHDVLYTNLGQWKYPGQVTRIPSNDITMQGVPYPVYGEDDLGYSQMMYPGMDYQFPGQYVTEIPMAQDGWESKINKALGQPMKKAQEAAKGDRWYNKKTKKWEQEDDVDNFRHPMAGRYTAEAITNKFPSWMQYTGIPQAAGFVGANALGIGHEITNPNQDPNYSWWDVVREAGEDIFNNAVGAGVGVLPMSDDKKTEMLWNLSKNNRLPDGYAKANMYFKAYGGDPSLANITGHYQKGGPSVPPEKASESSAMSEEDLFDNYYNLKQTAEAEKKRVEEVRKKAASIAASKAESKNPNTRTDLSYIKTGAFYCNTHTGECLQDAGATTPEGKPVPVIPGNLQWDSMAPGLGFEWVDEPQPGDVAREQIYRKSDYQGNPLSPGFYSSHSGVVTQVIDPNDPSKVFIGNAPGGVRNKYVNETISEMVHNRPSKDYRMKYQRYVGNIPKYEQELADLQNKISSLSTNSMPMKTYSELLSQQEPELQLKKTGGWLDELDEEYRRGGSVNPLMRSRSKRASTKKNIQSSINKIFLRNYDLFGPGGKNIYDPKAKYQQGGGWLDNLD